MFLRQRQYKLYLAPTEGAYYSDWEENSYICDTYMSAMPSRDDVLDALGKAGELSEMSNQEISDIRIERPDGLNYKKILVFDPSWSNDEANWIFLPSERGQP